MGKKIEAVGVHGSVFKDLIRPLEELASHPDVQKVNANKSFQTAGGKHQGLRPGTYYNHALKVRCTVSDGGQEVYVVVNEEAVDRVRQYVEGLSRKYFR